MRRTPGLDRRWWSVPSFGRSVAILAAFIALSSYNQLLLLPFERAFTPALRKAPAVVVAIPVFIAAGFNVGVWFGVSLCLAAWSHWRSPGDPLSNTRACLALVAWCHLPHLLWTIVSLPPLVVVLRAFDGIAISPQSVAARADALAPLKVVGAMRPWSWLACLALLVLTVSVQKRSLGQGCAMVLPPIAALLVLASGLLAMLPE
jgi:hypothetical protein